MKISLPILFSILLSFSLASAQTPEGNPFVKGKIMADPEVLFSQQTGKVYVYPTGGNAKPNAFGVYSTDDLVHWNYDGIVLDLADVPWAKSCPWAPSIIERKIGDRYQYFFYFCSDLKIGVAVGDSPTGPFHAQEKPLIAKRPSAAPHGVQIDPDVFQDPQTGKYYLFWGNSYLAMAELNDDMISLKPETLRVLNIPGFFEGVHLFFRNGFYYLTWSKNDTRSVEYQLRYAYSRSLDGDWIVPDDNLILYQRPEKQIFGPGHHSVLQIPGSDEWYVFYHRLLTPLKEGSWDRELCLDRLYFEEDGTIRKIIPTREGITEPVQLQR